MAADNIKYRFIQNIGDYFPSGYFGEDFIDKVQKASGLSSDDMNALCPPFVALRGEYEKYKNYIVNTNPRVKDAILHTHDFHTRLLKILGYNTSQPYDRFYSIDEDNNSVVPVRHILSKNGRTTMLVMEMQPLIKVDDQEPAGLFEQQYNVEVNGSLTEQTIRHQQYYAGQWSEVFTLPQDQRISPAIINKAIDALFLLPEERRPHFILMLAGNTIFLLDSDKWNRGAYLEFSLDELFSQASISAFRKYYALFHLLTCKDTLASDSETVLMDTLLEDSYKNAYEVTKDLKEGVVLAVETLANEALYYKQHVAHESFGKKIVNEDGTEIYDETDDDFEAEVKDDCLTIIYRLLFIFYAESRSELEILPTSDEIYKQGYSLEMLRDLEQTRLNSQQSRDGYFFDDSIQHLFQLLSSGYNKADSMINNKSFRIRPIDSPLFDNKRLHHLGDVRIRNCKWQEIICALSLSKKNSRFGRGRISYANLGVNQLGSVYESLLAFRGFYAEEDYIEVHKAGKPEEGTFLVPYSRMDDFESNEILSDEDERPKILPRGTFVYRLNGRDRQKSASYYTPEVLTRSTVKYTLKSIIDEVAAGKRKATDLLELKILEPAMGAAAFQNEVINQISEAYLTYQQQQQRERGLKNWRISPDHYRDELQKVKAFIATHNVYGVDLNPTAIELGKLSLWLNVIHKDMETPFFANRLTVGNAVIGAWLKVYNRDEVYGIKGRNKLEQNKWWERAPHKISFYSNRVKRSVNEVYHFLLPDNNMLGVRSIAEQKKANKDANDRMTTILKDWTAPIGASDFATLQRISAKIDVLLKDYFTAQLSIDKYTNNRKEIWDGIDHADSDSVFKEEERMESYAKKQQLFDTRYGHDNAYHKLKLVMDYWCALWFWESKDAYSLPTRAEYWGDIEALLNVDNDKIDARTRQALERSKTPSLFVNKEMEEYNRISEDEAQIVLKSQKEILTEAHAHISLFADEEPLRFQIVERLAERYHFFHPMLEFIEVFWLRDGFDVICGNPPFLKLTFNESEVLSEYHPEIVIKNISAPIVRKNISKYINSSSIKEFFENEQISCAATRMFLNSICMYPLLVGQQTDLYKCIITNCFDLKSNKGQVGLVHPDEIFTDAKGKAFRTSVYHKIRYRFQYDNILKLFAEVHAEKGFDIVIYGEDKDDIQFDSISNVYHPSTIDLCYAHDGIGICNGIDRLNQTSINKQTAHKNRIIRYNKDLLTLIGKVFENTSEWESVKPISIHSTDLIRILNSLEKNKHVGDFLADIKEGWHATNSIRDGFVKEETEYPDYNSYQMIFNSTQVNILSPFSIVARSVCRTENDYDSINYNRINEGFRPRTNFMPAVSIEKFKENFDVNNSWFTECKMAFRKMLDSSHERTLKGALLPEKASFMQSLVAVKFKNVYQTLEFAGISSSLIADFLIKIIKCGNTTSSVLLGFPMGLDNKFVDSIVVRVLRLNCVSSWYNNIWESNYKEIFNKEQWSFEDSRFSSYSDLTSQWNINSFFKNEFERRHALIELDVIVAMGLGLSLNDLLIIYENYFPITQKYDSDTWFDKKGNIIFTNKNKYELKVSRNTWNAIKDDNVDKISLKITTGELYKNETLEFIPPYERSDRIADYRRAWAHFEQRFK